MPIRRAFVRAAITSTVLIALSAVAIYAVASRLPENGLKLLKGAAVGDLTVTPEVCLMNGCDDVRRDPRVCLMRKGHLRDLDAECSRRPLRIRLVQHWPMRPGAPL